MSLNYILTACLSVITSFGLHNKAHSVSISSSILEKEEPRLQVVEGALFKVMLLVANGAGLESKSACLKGTLFVP